MADIHETAYSYADAFSDWFGCDSDKREQLTKAFERAIIAERQRCRRIVGNAMVLGHCTVRPYRAIRDGAEP